MAISNRFRAPKWFQRPAAFTACGYTTFSNDGRVLVVPEARENLLDK
jgi:hypothetical protein